MPKRKLLIDAGTKKIYSENSDDDLIVVFNDNLPDVDGKANGKVKGKGSLNGLVSAQIFEYLESHNILTHFISKHADKEIQVKNIDMLPIEVVIYNAADKILSKKYGFEESTALSVPVIEYIYLNEKLKNPVVNDTHLGALNILSPEELIFFCRMIAKTNAVLKSFFERRHLFLAKLQLSIGRSKGKSLYWR